MQCAHLPIFKCLQTLKRKAGEIYQDCFIAPRSEEELYSLAKDIHCLNNIAHKRTMKEELSRLRLVLKVWQESVGDVFPGEENIKQDDGRFARPLGR